MEGRDHPVLPHAQVTEASLRESQLSSAFSTLVMVGTSVLIPGSLLEAEGNRPYTLSDSELHIGIPLYYKMKPTQDREPRELL